MAGVTLSATENAAGLSSKARLVALLTVAIAFVMDLVDATIVNIAIPTIQRDLGASDTAAQWMVSGYLTTFAILLVTGGRLGDILGYRTTFLLGIASFSVASLMCGIALSPEWLVASRFLQGAMAAIMLPQVMALVQVMYPPHERVSVLAVFGVIGGLSAVLGPILGGLIISADLFGLGWRPIFLINLPIGILALFVGARVLPRGRSHHRIRLDWSGTLFVGAALILLLFPLVEGRAFGWPAWMFVMIGLSPIVSWLAWRYFRARSAKGISPLVEPTLFNDRSFSLGVLLVLVFQIVGGGFFLTLTLMLQYGMGMGPLQAALMHIPFAVGATFSIGIVTRKLLPRVGPSLVRVGTGLYATGLLAIVASLWLLAGLPRIVCLELALLVSGLGMGLITGPATPIALSEVDTGHAGSASGVVKATQQVGGALGASLIGSIFFGTFVVTAPDTAVNGFMLGVAVMLACLAAVFCIALFIPRNLKVFGGKALLSAGGPLRAGIVSRDEADTNPAEVSADKAQKEARKP